MTALTRSMLCSTFVAMTLLASTGHGQRDLKDIPDPDPEEELRSFIVADGFEVNLYAGDPQIAKPIQMNFDAEGRLWIASSTVYPHIKPGQKAEDKILVIEDTDGNGAADKTTAFADDLLIPTGAIPGDGGVYVCNSTELIHLRDTDDDGRADKRDVVLSGFGTEDTHHLLHTLRWGHDGCLYMNQSIYIHSHVETPYGVKRLNGGGIWRFRPETLELEVLCRGFVNSWGHHFDEWGQSFATDGAYGEGINYVFPGSVFFTAVGAKRILKGLNPGSPKHCGLEILSGRHLPESWRGNMITNDFRAHRVCRFVVSEDGSGYASKQETEVIKTKHVAFRPIDVKMGPDGAIYIADWYNPIIQHGEVDFRDPRRDHVHGRIWRVTAKGRETLKPAKIVGQSVDTLLDHLKAPEEWVRLWAKLELKSHDPDLVLETLSEWLEALDEGDPNYEHHRLEALWVHESLNRVDEAFVAELLRSNDHRVRAAAMRVVSHRRDELQLTNAYLSAGVIDDHPRVRLEAVRGLAGEATPQAAQTALLALDRSVDRFLDFALWQAMQDLEPYWLPAVREGQLDFNGNIEHLTFALKAVDSPGVAEPLMKLVEGGKLAPDREDSILALIASLGGAQELAKLVNVVFETDRSVERRAALLNALVEATRQRRVRPEGDLSRLGRLTQPDNALALAATRAIGAWRVEGFRRDLAKVATTPELRVEQRLAVIDSLRMYGGKQSVDVLTKLANADYAKDVTPQVLASLTQLDPKAAAPLAVAALHSSDVAHDAIVRPFLQQKAGPSALASALHGIELPSDSAKLCIRAVRASAQPAPELLAAFRAAGNLAEGGWKLTPELLADLVADVREKGDPHRGESIFRRAELQCLKCHAIAGAGGRVGPDLVSIGASAQPDYLVESLIEPNKKIKESFHSLVVATDEGKVLTGIPIRQSDEEIVLRDAEDRELVVPTETIEERRDGRSLMAEGLVNELTREELVDLVRFLSELGKVGDFAVGKTPLVRRWETLVWTPEAHRRINRTSFDVVASDEPVFQWQPTYSQVGGSLPADKLARFKPHPSTPQTAFVRCAIEVSTAGQVGLRFNSADGLALWVDGKPTRVESTTQLDLSRDRHALTIAIDTETRLMPLQVELEDIVGSSARAQIISGK